MLNVDGSVLGVLYLLGFFWYGGGWDIFLCHFCKIIEVLLGDDVRSIEYYDHF